MTACALRPMLKHAWRRIFESALMSSAPDLQPFKAPPRILWGNVFIAAVLMVGTLPAAPRAWVSSPSPC